MSDNTINKNKRQYKSSRLISFLTMFFSFLFWGITIPNWSLSGIENIDAAENISTAMCIVIGSLVLYLISGTCKNKKIEAWQVFISVLFGFIVFFLMIPTSFAISSLIMIFF